MSPLEAREGMRMRRTLERVDAKDGFVEVIRFENDLAVTDFKHGPDQKRLCADCHNFNRNLSCPPFSPGFSKYVGPAGRARVICLRLPLDRFATGTPVERAQAAFRLGSAHLNRILLKARRKGHLVAGSGECRACDSCAAAGGDPECVRPDLRIYSLESLGVQVADLVAKCFDLDLQWTAKGRPATTVSAVGAIF